MITVGQIKNRIETEFLKYSNSKTIDWMEMCARKIHATIPKTIEDLSDKLNAEVVYCEIETSQFYDGSDKYRLHTQRGKFIKKEMRFYPIRKYNGNYVNGDHEVSITDMEQFKACVTKLL
jgi:hypothetical protein